jgi:hypothetical protein
MTDSDNEHVKHIKSQTPSRFFRYMEEICVIIKCKDAIWITLIDDEAWRKNEKFRKLIGELPPQFEMSEFEVYEEFFKSILKRSDLT